MSTKENLPNVTGASTKKELFDAYNEVVKKLEAKSKQELNPEKIIEEKKTSETVTVADKIVSSGVSGQIATLKGEILKNLNSLEQDFNAKTGEYQKLLEAIKIREEQLKELYEIEKAAGSLAALIDAHKEKKSEQESYILSQKEQFEEEMQNKKAVLESEIKEAKAKFEAENKEAKAKWDKEQKDHDLQIKERDNSEEKIRLRAKEEYNYSFEREKQQSLNKLNDEKSAVIKEITELKDAQAKKSAEALKNIETRESAVALREKAMADLENKVAAFPKELESTVNKAVKDTSDRLTAESKAQINLLSKEFEGKANVYQSKIESLTALCEEQKTQLLKLTESLSAAYEKVQNIAVRTVEGATNFKFNQEQYKQQSEKA